MKKAASDRKQPTDVKTQQEKAQERQSQENQYHQPESFLFRRAMLLVACCLKSFQLPRYVFPVPTAFFVRKS